MSNHSLANVSGMVFQTTGALIKPTHWRPRNFSCPFFPRSWGQLVEKIWLSKETEIWRSRNGMWWLLLWGDFHFNRKLCFLMLEDCCNKAHDSQWLTLKEYILHTFHLIWVWTTERIRYSVIWSSRLPGSFGPLLDPQHLHLTSRLETARRLHRWSLYAGVGSRVWPVLYCLSHWGEWIRMYNPEW